MSETRAFIETETGNRIDCLFNPETLSLGFRPTWKGDPVAGRSAPLQRYGGGDSGQLSVTLVFDTTSSDAAVTEHTDKLVRLTQPNPDLPGYAQELDNGRPEWAKFHWGGFHSFKAVVTDLGITFTHFGPDGTPKRARVALTMEQYDREDDWPRQNPTSGTPKPARAHRVRPGETLDRIAAHHYGQPGRWRDIAAANGVRDPFDVTPGTILDVPMVD